MSKCKLLMEVKVPVKKEITNLEKVKSIKTTKTGKEQTRSK